MHRIQQYHGNLAQIKVETCNSMRCVCVSIMGFIDGDIKITSLKHILGWSKCYKFKPHWGRQVYPAVLTLFAIKSKLNLWLLVCIFHVDITYLLKYS